MKETFYFYDLETSGFNPREARIMQFAGQRTDLQLKPIGDPDNFLIKITEDVLPEPDAVLITGITPQKTISEGLTEADFLKYFHEKISLPGTIFTGFNTIRFDDEFMRFLNYRNFYDPYEWQWLEGRSKWDILDVTRMTRALRPEGIKWPFDSNGKPTNRLELLSEINSLNHESAHDALSDVQATISLARLIFNKQPKLFNFLVDIRSKNDVRRLVESSQPFVYTSGKFSSDFEKTTIVAKISNHPNTKDAALVFDLRYDPSAFIDLSIDELTLALKRRTDEEGPRLPVKTIKFNRCPAIAPVNVVDESTKSRLEINLDVIEINFKVLNKLKDEFSKKLYKVIEKIESHNNTKFAPDSSDVDALLYEGFFNDSDKTKMSLLRASDEEDLSTLDLVFKDSRLFSMLPLYIARNFPKQLNDEQRETWDKFRERKLLSGGVDSKAVKYFNRISEISKNPQLSSKQAYLLEELKLYGESILPVY